MSDIDRLRVRELFADALELPLNERATFLNDACGGDEGVRGEVMRLLSIASEADIRLEVPSAGAHGPDGSARGASETGAREAGAREAGDGDAWPGAAGRGGQAIFDHSPGDMIGRYRLVEPLGNGGFGSVWRAEQLEPLRRDVALKIIKLGMDTRQVIARFETERQSLALMDHPHIATVLEAGATSSGRPYFVMELVRGDPILEHCDARRLTIRERLKLFIQTCNAIQHAHQKGVIHRDIKPSNVLMTAEDEAAVRVIDFGIAKATRTPQTEQSLVTQDGQFIGTPAYMSPEQADAGSTDVDTRSDIYSLGVLLYELLTGTTPFETKTLMSQGLEEMKRQIREVPPRRPSLRLMGMVESRERIAKLRRSSHEDLARQLRGDLDWIAMKCLEKEPGRRYDTAIALALDVARHLGGHPVVAAPASQLYSLRKFIGRHRLQVLAAVGVGTALLLGVIGTSTGMMRALKSERQRVDLLELAQVEAEGNRALTAFLTRVLSLGDPSTSGRADLSVRELLIEAETSIDTELAAQPKAEAQVRLTLGTAYFGLSEPERSEVMLRRAVELLEQHDPENFWALYEAHRQLAYVKEELQIGGAEGLVAALEHAGALMEPDYPVTARLIRELRDGATSRQFPRILTVAGRIREQAPKELAEGDPRWALVIECLWIAASAAFQFERYETSVAFYRVINRWAQEKAGVGERNRIGWTAELGMALAASGQREEARDLFSAALAGVERTYSAKHVYMTIFRGFHGRNLVELGDYGEAEQHLGKACGQMVGAGTLCIEGGAAFAAYIDLLDRRAAKIEAAAARSSFATLLNTSRSRVGWQFARMAIDPERAALAAAGDALADAMKLPADRGVIESCYRALQPHWHGARRDAPAEAALIALYVTHWSDAFEQAPHEFRRQICVEALETLEETGTLHGIAAIGAYRELHKRATRDGDHATGEAMARKAWEASRALWGAGFHSTAIAQRELGTSLSLGGSHGAADQALTEAFLSLRAQTGAGFATHLALRELLRNHAAAGRFDLSIAYLPAAAEMFIELELERTRQDDGVDRSLRGFCVGTLGAVNPALARASAALTAALGGVNRSAGTPGSGAFEAASLGDGGPGAGEWVTGAAERMRLVDAVLAARRLGGPGNLDPGALGFAFLAVGTAQEQLVAGRAEELLVPLLMEAREILRAQVGPLAMLAVECERALVEVLLTCGRFQRAEALASAHAAKMVTGFGAESAPTLSADLLVLRTLIGSGRLQDAIEHALAGYPQQKAGGFGRGGTRRYFQLLCELGGSRERGARVWPLLLETLEAVSALPMSTRRDYGWAVACQAGLPHELHVAALACCIGITTSGAGPVRDSAGERASVEGATAAPDVLDLRALGAAQYRAGQYRESVATLLLCTQDRDQGGGAAAHLFLAMAYCRLGDVALGQAQLRLARTLLARSLPRDDEAALLAETEALAGI